MRDEQVKYGRITATIIALGALLSLALFGTSSRDRLSLLRAVNGALAPPTAQTAPRHKYVLLNAWCNDQIEGTRITEKFKDKVRSKFGAQIQIDPRDMNWPALDTCREEDLTCDRIHIDVENRQLRIWCPKLSKTIGTIEKGAADCPPNLSPVRRKIICLDPLPGELSTLLKAHADDEHGGY